MAQVNQSCLKKLKTFRKKFDCKDEKKIHQILHDFFSLIDNCKGKLPNLRDIFEPREIDWLVGSRNEEGQTLLHLAVTGGNKKATELLLRNGSDPNAANKSSLMTPLHIICDWENNNKSTTFLKIFFDINDELNQQVKVNIKASSGRTALHLALMHKNVEVAILLLRNGSDPNAANTSRLMTPLHIICDWKNKRKSAVFLKLFFDINDELNQQVKVNAQNFFGQTALHLALEHKNMEVAKLLLRRGASSDLPMKGGSTPLHMIFNRPIFKDDERATFLKFFFDINNELHQPINVDILDKQRRSILHYAVERRHKKMTEWLLRRGADSNVSDKDGYTPLHIICINDDDKRTEWFLKFFFDLNDEIHQLVKIDALNKSNETPLLLALKNKNIQVAKVLLRRGASTNFVDSVGSQLLHLVSNIDKDVKVSKFLKIFFEINDDKHYQVQIDDRDERGWTPLCMALNLGLTKTAEVLLRNGANPNLTNEEDSTPLHIICAGNYDDRLTKFLPIFFHISDDKNQLVQVNVRDKKGLTPLQLAVENLLPDVVAMLLDRGADLSSFVFPTVSHFIECFDDLKGRISKLELVSRLLVVIEHLEKKGYGLDLRNALTIMKTFAEWKLYDKSLELASRRFRRRWTIEFFLMLTRYQLPILCCEKIIDLLNNEDLLGICQAAEIVVKEET